MDQTGSVFLIHFLCLAPFSSLSLLPSVPLWCLSLSVSLSLPQLGSAILEAVEQNTLSVEPVGFQPLPVVKASAVECGGPK